MALAYDTLLATTLANHRKTLTDNVFLKLVLFWWLTEKNRVRMEDGGRKIVEPLIYAQNTGGGSYSDWEQLAIVPQENITAAEFDWKYIYDTIAISGQEEFKNSGRAAVLNMLKAKTKVAELSLRSKLNVMLHLDGTGNSGKDWDGLGSIVGDHTSAVTTVGGINCAEAGNEFWRSRVYDKAAALTPTHADLRAWLTTAWNDTSDDGSVDTIDAILVAQDVHEFYEAGLTANVQYQDVKAANAGFTNILFKQAPMFLDKGMTAGEAVGINSEYMSVVGGKGRWFRQSKFSGGVGEDTTSTSATTGAAGTVDGKYAVITTYGNVTTSNRSRHFRIKGIVTP